MLSLDSPRWVELVHAYGSASEIPKLLEALQNAAVRQQHEVEPWFSLWSSLCHQCDVYSASYAALPHIIDVAGRREPQDRTEYFHMAGTIESMRHRRTSPAIPPDLVDAYQGAIRAAVPMLVQTLLVEEDEGWFQALLSALAAFRGFPELAAGVGDLERLINCPKCGAEFVCQGFDWFDRSSTAP